MFYRIKEGRMVEIFISIMNKFNNNVFMYDLIKWHYLLRGTITLIYIYSFPICYFLTYI